MTKEISTPSALSELSEDEIRDYAYHLYEQSSCAPGRDLDNWLEATACLKASIPADRSHVRLHHQGNGPAQSEIRRRSKEGSLVF